VLLSRAQVARCSKDLRRADDLFARSRATVASIADSVRDDRIKQGFLRSRLVREICSDEANDDRLGRFIVNHGAG
jgi:hypothetical protein